MVVGSSDGLEIYGVIASGGMATIQYARQATAVGALELVIKRPHAHFATEPDFVKMFMHEAQLSIRIQHANVVRTLGVIERPELALVLEYVLGESLGSLFALTRAAKQPVPTRIATALIAGVLHGLHAAHETRDEDGKLLDIVHRDVSPDNILVGVDGVARVLDFGIANAISKLRSTPSGEIKGKLAYIAPEQLSGHVVTRRADVYGAGVVLWEALAGRSLFAQGYEASTIEAVLRAPVPALRCFRDDIPDALDRIIQKALSRNPAQRYDTAQSLARALEAEVGVATQSLVVDWLEQLAGPQLRARSAQLRSMQVERQQLSTASGARASALPPLAARPSQHTLVVAEPEHTRVARDDSALTRRISEGTIGPVVAASPRERARRRPGKRSWPTVAAAGLGVAAFGVVFAVHRGPPPPTASTVSAVVASEPGNAAEGLRAPAAAAVDDVRFATEHAGEPPAVGTQAIDMQAIAEPVDTIVAAPRGAAPTSSTWGDSLNADARTESAARGASDPPSSASAQRKAFEPTSSATSPRSVLAAKAPTRATSISAPRPLTTPASRKGLDAAARARVTEPRAAAHSSAPDPAPAGAHASLPPSAAIPQPRAAGRFQPTGPDACYDTVVRNGIATRVPKPSCLRPSSSARNAIGGIEPDGHFAGRR